jgi:tRNA-specific 2-thiouridylase
MIEEYEAGRTPNPDIMCNQEIKFKLFLETALADGAEYVATGHYAKTRDGKLFMAEDANKDQTYFLYRVTSAALDRILFPLGEFTKPQVRQMAAERGLTTAAKKDSVGICFVGQIGMREFLTQYVTTKPGDIVDAQSGAAVGRHDGAIFYTLGQRHGLDIGGGLPYYVVGKDMHKNEVYVSRDLNDRSLWNDTVSLESLHAVAGKPLADGQYKARVRHRAPLRDVTLNGDVLTFTHAERAAAPGQSVVLYKDQECVGGGIIRP